MNSSHSCRVKWLQRSEVILLHLPQTTFYFLFFKMQVMLSFILPGHWQFAGETRSAGGFHFWQYGCCSSCSTSGKTVVSPLIFQSFYITLHTHYTTSCSWRDRFASEMKKRTNTVTTRVHHHILHVKWMLPSFLASLSSSLSLALSFVSFLSQFVKRECFCSCHL